ncbi:MAG: hypothetical protein ACXWQO_17050, partial [Bdellovibrionota bacterium]
QDTSENSLWLGPSAARQISENFSVGASLFAARYSANVNSITYINAASPASVTTSGLRVTVNDWALLAILGAQWRINPRWSLGLRVQTASLGLRGRTDYFISTQVSGANASQSIENENGIYSRFRRPFNIGFGTKFSAASNLDLFFDVNAQLPVHYNTAPSRATINARMDTKFTPRANLGAKWTLSSAHKLLFGLIYNPSTLPSSGSVNSGEVHENFKGASLGLQKDMGALTSSIGGFYLWSTLAQPIATTATSSSYSHQVFGLLLTASYKL